MNELTNLIFSQVNIVLTSLLILLIIYWLVSMISGIDFDFDIDVDVDLEIDANIDVDGSIESGTLEFSDTANTQVNKEDVLPKSPKKLKAWQIVLIYFNFVDLPFLFTFTFWIFSWWFITIIATIITNSYDHPTGFIWFFIALIPSLFISKIITTPFKRFFKNLNKDGDKAIDFIGRVAISQSHLQGDKMGNITLKIEDNPYTIYAKSLEGNSIKYQEKVLIIKQSKDKNYYYVQNYIN